MKKRDSKENRFFKRAIVIFIIAFIVAVAGDVSQSRGTGMFDHFTVREATTENGRELILVNSRYSVPDDFELDLITLSNGEQIDSNVYEYLQDNAYKYGFIKRYPADKTEITGISNEPWHYRFVGLEAAEEMYEMNLCLEEYIEYIS